jgi:enoyl-CoA hydratase
MSIMIERNGACWMVTLDRPQAANALSADLIEKLIEVVAEAEQAGAAVLAFKGQGRNFSAGFDFGGIDTATDAELLHRFVRIELLLQAVANSPCLTVALAHGPTYGAGADLFAVCRWRIADPGARFRMPGLAFGIVLGTRRLAALVGRERARELLGALRAFDASEALAMGFATRLVETAGWPRTLEEALGIHAQLPAASRAALRSVLASDLDDRSLADLVRSAAVPGLRGRMVAYREAQQSARRRINPP